MQSLHALIKPRYEYCEFVVRDGMDKSFAICKVHCKHHQFVASGFVQNQCREARCFHTDQRKHLCMFCDKELETMDMGFFLEGWVCYECIEPEIA